MTRRALLSLAVLFAALGGLGAFAQTQPPPGLLPPRGPPPGVYTIRPLNDEVRVCLTDGHALYRTDFVTTGDCAFYQYGFDVLPHPWGGYTLRRGDTCTTVARGVVLGPAAVDLVRCGTPEGAPAFAWPVIGIGVEDQRFNLQPVGTNLYKVAFWDDRCWDIRGAQRGADLILWACHEGANQRFEFEYAGPLNGVYGDMIRRFGWQVSDDGRRWANGFKGWNLPGSDLRSLATGDDDGAACAKACADDAQCKAYTWVRPAAKGDKGVCWIKGGVPRAQAYANGISGVVF